jgi:hypothetical protein
MSAISFDPMKTSAPQNSFLTQTEGLVQGTFLDDPSANMWMASGKLDSTVTQSVWGGMAITEKVNAPGANQMGNTIVLAAANANITGFTVFNRGNNMIITPGNTVPQAGAGMTIMYFRTGSNARIAVQCDNALAATLDTGNVNQQVSWDFTNQKLITYSSSAGALACKVLLVTDSTSKVVNYNSGTGALTWATGYVALIQI